MTRKILLCGVMVAAVACSTPEKTAPLAPTARVVDVAALNPDGSSLKFSAPGNLSPNGGTLADLQPTFTWAAATSQFSSPVPVTYDFEGQNAAGAVVFEQQLAQTSVQLAFELPYSTTFWWRVRARRFNDVGPWSGFAQIRTPEPPPPPPPPPTPTPTPTPGGGLPFPVPAECGPFGPGNRIGCVAAVAGQSAEWLGCLQGIGTRCHRFARQVVFALSRSDPNWQMITAAPGGNACNCNACGPSDGTMFREDTTVYAGNRVFDMIVGAGGPFPGLNWSEVPGPRPGDIPSNAPLCVP